MKLLPTLMTGTLSLVIIGCGEEPKGEKAAPGAMKEKVHQAVEKKMTKMKELVPGKVKEIMPEKVTEVTDAAKEKMNKVSQMLDHKKVDIGHLTAEAKKALDIPVVNKVKEVVKYTTETATTQGLSIFEKCMGIAKSVTTEAEATSAVDKLAPLVAQAEQLKKDSAGVAVPSKAYLTKVLGENKAQASTIKSGLMSLATNMVKAPGIYKILQPTIDKLKASLGLFYQPIANMLMPTGVKNISVEGLKKSGLKRFGF